jgi:branched-chain amino acid transport system substrate-binding protein
MSLSRLIKPLLLCGALLFGAVASHAQADKLRIGFIAPMTGLFAQVGKDMVDGFRCI